MDVVYIVGPDETDELRYSLRSLKHLEHARVWIVGHKPGWVTGVEHVPTVQDGDRFTNSTRNVRTICDRLGWFVLFNDDFFALQPTDVPNWHRGPAIATPRRTGRASYPAGMEATVWLLDRWGYRAPLNYDLHVPMWVHGPTMAAVLDAAPDLPALHKRTLYGNVAALGGTKHDDVKVGNLQHTWPDGQTWVSTSDRAFADGAVGRRLRSLFPDPSPYERSA